MKGRILITPRSLSNGGNSGLQPLVEAGYELCFPAPGKMPCEAELLATVPACIGWLAGVEPVSEAVVTAADQLRVISRNGTGVDNLPLEALSVRGVAVRRAEGTNSRGVAELALAMSFAGLRHLIPTHLGIAAGGWPRRIGREIYNSKVAVIGLGAVGSQFARFNLALDARVFGYDPAAPDQGVAQPNFHRVSFEEALHGANVVSLHAPIPSDGRALLAKPDLALLARSAVVVNTARAGLVDSPAMLAALNDGQVGAYATDVFETEPPRMSDLLAHPDVLLTSHIGGYTAESVERTTEVAVTNILEVLEGHAHRAG